MSFPKLTMIFALVGMMFLLAGCGYSPEEDRQRIVNWMDKAYGENSYTIEQNPENKRYFIISLHKYPNLKFNATIAHDVKTKQSYLWSEDRKSVV